MESSVGPTSAGERHEVLDVVRGIALFGILVVNIGAFAHTGGGGAAAGGADAIASHVVQFAFFDKFYALFAFLFGYGFALQMERGATVVPRLLRRFLFLFLLGVAHMVLLFYGDVLMAYALMGTALLLFRRLSAKAALLTGVGMLVAVAAAYAVAAFAMGGAGGSGGSGGGADAALEAYRASPGGAIGENVRRFVEALTYNVPLTLPNYLALFLIGLAAARFGLLHRRRFDSGTARRTLVRVALGGLLVGVPGALASTLYPIGADIGTANLLARGLSVLTAPALTAAYVAILLLVLGSPAGNRVLRPLAAAGRLALTNYIGQSAVCALLFSGLGFALAGRVGAVTALGVAVALFAVQVAISGRWIRSLRFGPLEWLLRSFTYAKKQPMLRS